MAAVVHGCCTYFTFGHEVQLLVVAEEGVSEAVVRPAQAEVEWQVNAVHKRVIVLLQLLQVHPKFL